MQLSTHVNAAQGEPLVALVSDHAGAEAEAHADAKSGLFVGAEAVNIGARAADSVLGRGVDVHAANRRDLQEGSRGTRARVPRRRVAFRWLVPAPTDSEVGRIASHALTQLGALPRSTEPLLPVVGIDTAVTRFKRIIQATPGYAGGRPRMHGLVYLPAVRASFANKEGRRDATFVAGAGSQFSNLASNPVRFGTFDLKLA